MVIKKTVTKTIKKKPAASQIKSKAAPVKKAAVKAPVSKPSKAVTPTVEIKEYQVAVLDLPHAIAWQKIQTAEGWKRGLKKGKAKKS